MDTEEIKAIFEQWYKAEYLIREGARGRASRHLMQYDGEYISDHAAECYKVWCAAYKRMNK